ncbi:MAG TPA: hypothetical protein VIC81_07505 [Acidimicrobiales bacterium]
MKKLMKDMAVVGALVVSLGIVAPSVAFASGTTTTSSSTTSAWASFRTSWSAYGQHLKAINATFRTSIQSAHATFSAAMSAATDATAREAARTALRASIEAAMNTRVAAITALGNPPAPPAGYNGTAWVASFQAANVAFRASVTSAETAYVQAMQSATTPTQRKAARLALKTAVDAAVVAHSNALLALGTHPKKPGQPSA